MRSLVWKVLAFREFVLEALHGEKRKEKARKRKKERGKQKAKEKVLDY